jgi:hypothetical protein
MATNKLTPRRDHELAPYDDRSIGDLVADATRELGLLVRQEIALAQAEMRQQVKRLAAGAVLLAVGAAVAYAGFLALIAAWALGLVRLGAPAWAAVLSIGLVSAAVGGVLLRQAVNAFAQADPLPRRTAASVKQSIEQIKERVS